MSIIISIAFSVTQPLSAVTLICFIPACGVLNVELLVLMTSLLAKVISLLMFVLNEMVAKFFLQERLSKVRVKTGFVVSATMTKFFLSTQKEVG